MKMVIASIRDAKSEVFAQPWFTATAAAAVRSFSDIVNDPTNNSMISKHPEDFQLYELGTFDDQEGKLDVHALPKILVAGDSIKKDLPAIDRRHIAAV